MYSVRKSYQVVVMDRKNYIRKCFKDVFRLTKRSPICDLIPKNKYRWKQKIIWLDSEMYKGYTRVKFHEMINNEWVVNIESRRIN